ncbi:MAG: 2-alkenal reductase, partial [Proteobacteria bacterium]|nr:2-alkenal reductase [Burkholderiales bacterium]
MRRLWLLFAQTVTIALGLWLVVGTMRPDLLPEMMRGGRAGLSEPGTAPRAAA